MKWTAIAAVLLGLAVMLGAFGAHGLRARLDDYSMGIYERAVFYHFVHALGLLVVSLLPRITGVQSSWTTWVCVLLFGGILIFCGSLYTLAISGVRWLGAITPIGGLAFIVAWFLLAVAVLRTPR